MEQSRTFQAEVRQMLRDRILDAASDITAERGWGAVTMSEIAQRVGVSRQVLYRETGAKHALGETLVTREADRLVSGAAAQFRIHPASLADGIGAAAEATLISGAGNPLIRAIAAGSAGGDTELLPLLSGETGPVMARAIEAISDAAAAVYSGLELQQSDIKCAVEVGVRLTLSHLLSPLGNPEDAAQQIRLVARRLLA
ncbi:TetR family transcriptional regulator [Hoyosella altamirensis]|uniref:AcrR family transcriptional regulator n=1 Tax=Hoyosella altamirensis TaxID=616997 RepID=A0A839RM83_9ACTN|nr:TetR family transcriptional regulator [Hoyosella altamirensis]MBB3037308.1 AcrR family transcriptional regulator [Hoyosella altamirensis]